ncbi:MAG: acylphosphatase [Euryarchaeota archaeon]|nr:acylphosphatase [Euryarchaeota archaeon]MCG2736901.1 acylphosphatase [Candidatus Methanoperedenaceae archaeon]
MKIKTKIIGNKVHDVGYRVFLLRKALELGMERFNAYNTKENGVQVLVSFMDGDSDQISTFQNYVRNNRPENADISDIIFEDYAGHVIGIVDYMHLIQVEQLSKGIPAILSIDRKLDQNRTEISGEIRELRLDLRSYLDEKLIKIERDIFQIKAKIGLKA